MSEPFLFRGGDHGCLLLHGFTGAPGEMRGLGEHLAGQGYTVLCPRLPGHSDRPEDIAVVRWTDWLAAAADGLAYLRERCARVSLVGFSMGGALSIMLAAEGAPVHRLALLSVPLRLQGDWRISLLGLARHTMPWFYPFAKADFSSPEIRAQFVHRAADIDLDDLQVQEYIRANVKISVAGIDELRRLLARAVSRLPDVQTQALVMHGRNDDIAPLDSPLIMMRRLGSRRKELIWWDDTGHQMLMGGPHRMEIYDRVSMFLGAGQHS